MANSDDIGGRSVQKFLDFWNKHPLSIFVLIIFVNLSFVFMLFFGKIDSDTGLKLAWSTYTFSGIILISILIVLYLKRQVLYNALDVLTYDINHRIQDLLDSLNEIHIGVGEPYEEVLEWLCPKMAKYPIDNETRAKVHIYESLTGILERCSFENEVPKEELALINLALAKFYYKEQNFTKALVKINRIDYKTKAINAGEVHFCKALILNYLKRKKESQEQFDLAETAGFRNAKCWKCMNDAGFYETEEKILKFIAHVEICQNRHATVHCVNKLSSAFYQKARYFSHDNLKEKAVNLKKSNEIADIAIDEFDSGFAHFNKACNLSIMAQNGISIEENEELISRETMEKMKNEILLRLEDAFRQRPGLIRSSLKEIDLKWVKAEYEKDFAELIGKAFIANSNML